ncbi:hypothetical protein ACYOEI_12300 [Singulisphaera rosea]
MGHEDFSAKGKTRKGPWFTIIPQRHRSREALGGLSDRGIFMMLILEAYGQTNCWANPSDETLEKQFGKSPGATKEALKDLIKAGWIGRVDADSKGKTVRLGFLFKRRLAIGRGVEAVTTLGAITAGTRRIRPRVRDALAERFAMHPSAFI